MRTTQRTYDRYHHGVNSDLLDFTETTTGDAPSSVSVEFNAKGHAQIAVKVYKDDSFSLSGSGAEDVIEAIMSVASDLDKRGIVVAGISHEAIEAWRNEPADGGE